MEKLKTVFDEIAEDHLGKESWKEQFTAAVYINGSCDRGFDPPLWDPSVRCPAIWH